ncbi:uncharacterized protein [Nicotiana tomentosiformis]|uniref:uncharacterized protein n=1 Tax=Nicotiana tomentosiformis TaxID=4098 RepID=UPI00051B907C
MHGKILVCEIEIKDIRTELTYWKNAVMCYVLGAHPPFAVLNGFIQRMWAKHRINKISMLKNRIVLVRFDIEMGENEMLQGGIYRFDNKPFIVKAWDPNMEFNREELYSVPIWVKLLGLDFKYWSPKGLSKIGSLIGKPLMVDHQIEKNIGLNFARLLIEVDIDGPLSKKIMFKNERGNLVELKVQYDWKPILCKCSNKYGHNEEACRRKKTKTQQKKIGDQANKVAKGRRARRRQEIT